MITLPTVKNAHSNQPIIVCGCGASLNDFTEPQRFITIGVNDVGRKFQPNYLVVVNPRAQFTADRFDYVENSQASVLFTQLDLGPVRPPVVRFRLGTYGGTDFSDPDVLHYTQNSPYVAVCLAINMGATRIGLIGVDLTDHHFFGSTGRHPLAGSAAKIDAEYGLLLEACRQRGIELFNLSRISRLTSLPKLDVEAFASSRAATGYRDASASALSIVSYATTPVAGVPAILARCIGQRTPHQARCVWATRGYDNGVTFDGDIEWGERPSEAEQALREADLIIVHNGRMEERHRALVRDKAVLTMAHNYMWNVDRSFVDQGFPGLVVGQYQATLAEFAGWCVVPNPVPLWEPLFQPEPKADTVIVTYTPFGKHDRYPRGHRLYWHGKGYRKTMEVLDRLVSRYGIHVEAVRDRQFSHAESLAAKRRGHIVIDECVTGSYHRNSLEGLATGCVVVNGVGSLAGVPERFRQCALGCEDVPFVHATETSLEDRLISLIGCGGSTLAAEGARNRQWMERHWDFGEQWRHFWQPEVDRALHRAYSKRIRSPDVATAPAPSGETVAAPGATRTATPGLTVIIPQGGHDRLPLLAPTLANLGQCGDIDQIIVVELGRAPLARQLSARWGADYVFGCAEGPFNKARAINIGCGLARHDLLLWCDNDMILPSGFIAAAISEMRNGALDLFFPYGRLVNLSDVDSRAVLEGCRHPEDCGRHNVYSAAPQTVAGGVAMVRAEFVRRYGGMCEQFLGWGGEDNAWVHKVAVLGRWGITAQRDRTAYHLYHPDSGAAGKGTPARLNGRYQNNVALLDDIKRLRTAQDFLARFPTPPHGSLAWPADRKIAFLVPASASPRLRTLAESWEVELQARYGLTVQRFAEGADAWVTFGPLPPLSGDESGHSVPAPKRVAVLEDETSGATVDSEEWSKVAWLIAESPDSVASLQQRELAAWHRPWRDRQGHDEAQVTPLVQVLSLLLADPVPATQYLPPGEHRGCVWMYWEGVCPPWIRLCQDTVRAHAANARILDFDGFARLWTRDRDIDLSRLHVAQRADFVRAYLLAHYGGLWVDSDCIVMQSLEPLLDQLETCGFIAHRERQGFFSNAFLGAREGSPVAASFYETICETLRSGRPLGWIALGNQPLTTILRTTSAPWRELDCEQVQPICWSRPETFLRQATPTEHARHLNPRAICYMLSNQHVQRCLANHPRANLLQDGTFFRYLADRALAREAPPFTMPPSEPTLPSCEHLPFAIGLIREIAPARVLDASSRQGLWPALLREYCAGTPDLHVAALGSAEALGRSAGLYDAVIGSPGDGPPGPEAWNFALWDDDAGTSSTNLTIVRLLDSCDYVLAVAPPECPDGGGVTASETWPVIRHAGFPAVNGQSYRCMLLSRRDPKCLRRTTPIQTTLDQLYRQHEALGIESIAGPGSTLAQTVRLREQLPLLLQDLNAQSLLDLPCGDFNWLSRVRLGVNEYIGCDPVERVARACRERHGNRERTFCSIDPAYGSLPKADVILCRDFLGHLSLEDIAQVMANFCRSGSRYLLTTTFTRRSPNVDVQTGHWRPLNLELEPFKFPPPIRFIDEKCTESQGSFRDKCLGLWLMSDLKRVL